MEVVGMRDDIEPEATGQRTEENLLDTNAEVFDTILIGETIEIAKGKLEDLKNQDIDTCSVFRYFFHFFPVNQTPQCPEFVEWCIDNFFVAEGVIMNNSKSKIICSVQDYVIRKSIDILDEIIHISHEYR